MSTLEDLNKAILAYQKALTIDKELQEAKITAIDWFNYGKLLIKANASQNLALACFLKAEVLLKEYPGEELKEISKTREALEKSTGLEKAKIEKELDNYLNQGS